MKRISFSLVVAMLSFIIGLPASRVAQGQETQGQLGNVKPEFAPGTITPLPGQAQSCDQTTGANVQAAANGNGVEIIALTAGGLFNSVGFQQGDIIQSINGAATNDTVTFCNLINSNRGKIITIIVKDVNTNQQNAFNLKVPS